MTTTDTPAILRGPDPERFRTSHYGARWYIDPLPADNTWPATNDKWPSVTTIKKAWSKPFRKKLPTGEAVPLDVYWAAEFTLDHLPAVTQLANADTAAAMALICGAGARTLNRAADRGDGVHTVLETLGAGQQVDELLLDDAVRPFLPAARAFINEWQPTWTATEFVIINRTIGFGGTADAIIVVDIPGTGRYAALTDWKSRGGKHGCYEEEVAQIGGYSLAEYMVVADPGGHPARVSMPDLDGGLLVSLNHDGYQAYPVDLEQAQTAFKAMHASWREQREGQKVARQARQHPLIPTAPAAPAPEPAADADRLSWLRTRVLALKTAGHIADVAANWPDGAPTLKQGGLTDPHIDTVAHMLARLEAEHGIPFGPTDPLFGALATADQPVAPPARDTPSPVQPARDELARHWTTQIKTLLEQFDQAEQDAITALVVPEPVRSTEQHYQWIKAVIDELADPNGAVIFSYTTLGPTIEATDAQDRIKRPCKTKVEALHRAKRLAKELGRPTPRTFDHICADPALAALVAAGHGRAEHQPSNDEKETLT